MGIKNIFSLVKINKKEIILKFKQYIEVHTKITKFNDNF